MFEKLQTPRTPVDVVLDTDTYNEVDDQFALAYLFSSREKLRVRGVYAAPFVNGRAASAEEGMNNSYREIFRVLALMGIGDFKNVFKGSSEFLKNEKTPVVSDAARDLAERAMRYTFERPLYVVAIAALTNIASALLLNPAISERIVVVWLGGQARQFDDASEFNLNKDVAAARIVFERMRDSLVQVPCRGCVSEFLTTEAELRFWLSEKNKLCDYLVESVVRFHENCAGKPWSKPIWDVAAVAWLLNEDSRFMLDKIERIPQISYDRRYSYPENRGFMKYVYYIKRDALFEDLFAKISDERNFKHTEAEE